MGEQFVFYNSRIVEKMKTIDFILDGKFHLHTPKKEGFRTKSKVALKKKGALFGHSSNILFLHLTERPGQDDAAQDQ